VPNPDYLSLQQNIKNLEATRAALQRKLAQLEGIVSRKQSQFDELAKKGTSITPTIAELKQEEENYSRIYAALSSARITKSMTDDTTGSITVVNRRVEGPLREGKDPLKLTLAALILSLGLGVGLAVGMDYLDHTIRTREDAMDLIGLPVQGIVPRLNGGTDIRMLPKITQIDPSSPHAEAYRFLTTDLLLSLSEQDIKTIMGATAKPGQGGTSTICNLAITMAQAGKRVILVDCDMRRPMLHQIFNVSNELGLSDVLANGVGVLEALKPTEVPNLILLPAGETPDNAWSLLRSQKMHDLIHNLRQQSDFVFFDTPSAVVFADAAVIASMVDGVIIIVRANQSPRGNELQVKEMLNKANPNILGGVLNDVDPQMVDSYYYHNQYYPIKSAVKTASGTGKPERPLPAAKPTQDDDNDINPFGRE